ncbi:hypothetical protein JTB14_028359 [Gonioctena quinquepunctata]|nr:hypothetical protein JTB14_028359 [Gonioctena quinquepunctata]
MANTSINNALQAEKTPSIPDFISPATYNPCKGNANSFIKGYNQMAIADRWDEKLKICYFGSFLEGAANICNTIYTNLAANNTKTWSNISEDFMKEFGDQDVKKSVEMRLLQRKQGEHESVKAYFYDLKTLFYEYDPNLNPEDFRKFFENGIRPNVYWAYRLIREDNINMDKFKDIVLRLEDVLEKTPTIFFSTSPTAVPQVNQYTNPLANEGQTNQNMKSEKKNGRKWMCRVR